MNGPLQLSTSSSSNGPSYRAMFILLPSVLLLKRGAMRRVHSSLKVDSSLQCNGWMSGTHTEHWWCQWAWGWFMCYGHAKAVKGLRRTVLSGFGQGWGGIFSRSHCHICLLKSARWLETFSVALEYWVALKFLLNQILHTSDHRVFCTVLLLLRITWAQRVDIALVALYNLIYMA